MNLIFKERLHSKYLYQIFAVCSSNFFSMGIGFLVNIFLAKEMGLSNFGLYSFSFAVFGFVALFMEFGFYSTSAKVLADENDELEERKLLGGIFCVYLLMNFIFAVVMYILGYFIDDFFMDKIGHIVRNMAFSGYAYTAPFFMEWILQGCNKIYLLSQYICISKILHCILLFFIWQQNQLIPEYVLMSYAIACGISIFICYIRLKPIFSESIKVFSFLCDANRLYGWPQYLGRIVAVGSSDIYKIFVSYFVDAKAVGLYNLSLTFVSVVNVLGQGVGIAKFKSFAKDRVINHILIKRIKWASAFAAVLVVFISYMVIIFYLGSNYYNACVFIAILIFGGVARCNYTLYISWLTSHGYAKEIKNTLFRMGFVNFGLGILFTYMFSALGTCLAYSLGYCYIYYLYTRLYARLSRLN